tara:strand:- start:231 stop:512 length:282 start_codon:yes stop_codon:yes gene_type:complete
MRESKNVTKLFGDNVLWGLRRELLGADATAAEAGAEGATRGPTEERDDSSAAADGGADVDADADAGVDADADPGAEVLRARHFVRATDERDDF